MVSCMQEGRKNACDLQSRKMLSALTADLPLLLDGNVTELSEGWEVGNEHFPITSITCAVSRLGMAQRSGLTKRWGDGGESFCDLPHDLGKAPV